MPLGRAERRDALWALYQVGLAGVIDIQLLENGSRAGDKTYLCGLDKAIQLDLKLGFAELNRWTRSKKEMKSLMRANIFATRPVEAKTVQYCINDVIHLPALHALYLRRISGGWLAKAKEESSHRVRVAHSRAWEPQSAMNALGPWGSGHGKHVRSLDDMLDDLEDSLMEDAWDMYGDGDAEDYYDDSPTSCRDIIASWVYDCYYSD